MKYLPPTTVCQLFEIRAPIWNGGKRFVGLNKQRIGFHNEIRFTYRRKSDGELSFPDIYYFDGKKLQQVDYELKNVRGVTLVLVPFTDLEILTRQYDPFWDQPAKTIETTDPPQVMNVIEDEVPPPVQEKLL